MADITINDLTLTTLDGSGVFDVLMRATKTHLEAEFSKNRIKGAEYSSVYLGSLQSVLATSMEFLLQRQKIALEVQLMEQQVLVAQAEVQKANAQVLVALAEVDKTRLEVEILTLNKAKIPAEIAHIEAQTALAEQQRLNLISTNLQIVQQTSNAVVEHAVLLAQECKLKAEYDLLLLQKNRTTTETTLLTQKIATEKAQTTGLGVDADSVIGKQKALYGAQAIGFTRDAEQKAAQILVDTWKIRRTTDEGTVADNVNCLADAHIGLAVTKLMQGIGT